VTCYRIRRGSGGAGRHPGGDGIVRELEALAPMRVTLLSERRTRQPYGLWGGEAGAAGQNWLVRQRKRKREQRIRLPGKTTTVLEPGDRIRVETPGGGGWGSVQGARRK